MSIVLGNENIPVSQVIDPRLDINKKKEYQFLSGVSSILYRNINANSVSNSSVTFSYKPSNQTILSRRMYVKYRLRCVLQGTSSGQLVKIGIDDALRAFPLQTCSSAVKLRLNGSELSLDRPCNILPTLMRYSNFYDQSLDYSTCPSIVDSYQSYDAYTTLGTARNVLGQYGENNMNQNRASLTYTVVGSITSTDATIDIDVVEPLFVPTLLFSHKKLGPGFSNVQDLNLTFTLSDINRAWSHSNAGGSTLTSISVTLGGQGGSTLPQLLFEELTPSQVLAPAINDLNKNYLYPYKNLQTYVFDNLVQSLAPNATFSQVSLNSIQVGQIPSAVYLCVQERLQDKQSGDRRWRATDTFCSLTKLGFSVNGSANIMSEALPEQIYQVCQSNGLNDSYAGFNNYAGSSVLLQVGKDIPLPAGMAAGQVQNFNFQFTTVEGKNTSPFTKNLEFVVIMVFDAVFAISSTQALQVQGLLDTQNVLTAPIVENQNIQAVYGASFFGDVFDTIKSVGSKALNVGKNLYDTAKVFSPAVKFLAPETAPFLGAVGLGRKAKKGGLKMAGRVRKGKGLTGDFYGSGIDSSRRVGYMDREELQERLGDYEDDEDEEQYE